MNNTDEHFCPHCGVFYIHHKGLIPICAELQKAMMEIKNLKEELAELRDEMMEFNRRETEKIGKL